MGLTDDSFWSHLKQMGNKISHHGDRYYVETLNGENGSHGFYLDVPCGLSEAIERAKIAVEYKIDSGCLSKEHHQLDKMIFVFSSTSLFLDKNQEK